MSIKKESKKKSTAANTASAKKVHIKEWERSRLLGGHIYTIRDERYRYGILSVYSCEEARWSLSLTVVGTPSEPSAEYKHDEIVLPDALLRAIAKEEFTGLLGDLYNELFGQIDTVSNPHFAIADLCIVLQRHCSADQIEFLVKDLKDYGEDLGLDPSYLADLKNLTPILLGSGQLATGLTDSTSKEG